MKKALSVILTLALIIAMITLAWFAFPQMRELVGRVATNVAQIANGQVQATTPVSVTAVPVTAPPAPVATSAPTPDPDPEIHISDLGLPTPPPAPPTDSIQLVRLAQANVPEALKGDNQVAYEASIARELNEADVVGFSTHGRRISSVFADRKYDITFRNDIFRGRLNGRFNSVSEVRAAALAGDSQAWWAAYKLMLDKSQDTILADAQAEVSRQNEKPWLEIHVNACMRGDDKVRRYLEELDGLPEGSYQEVPLVRYRSHWVTRISEVSQAEYEAANEDFQGWHVDAAPGTYRAKYGTNPDETRWFVMEIFLDESKWAAIVVHSYDNPTELTGFSLGGVRHDDLSIVLPHDPCQGNNNKPVAPAPVETPEALEPKPADPAQYVHPTGKPIAPPPAEPPAATEPPSVTAVPVAAPLATPKPTVAPTSAPTAAPTPEIVIIDNPPAPAPYPDEPPSVEPGLGTDVNDGAIADPFGG